MRTRPWLVALVFLVPLSYYAGVRYLRGAAGSQAGVGSGSAPRPGTAKPESVAVDPMCGMSVDTAEARFAGRVSRHEGRDYYFCSPTCKKEFDADPAAGSRRRR